MSRFRTNYNYDFSGLYETPVGESMTEQDQSLSVQEILSRFTSGLMRPEEIEKHCDYYNEDIDNPDPHFLDITDVEDIGRRKEEILEELAKRQQG